MSSPQPVQCGKCGGTGVTLQTRHSVVTNPDGSQTPTVEQFTAPCTGCGGSGRTQ